MSPFKRSVFLFHVSVIAVILLSQGSGFITANALTTNLTNSTIINSTSTNATTPIANTTTTANSTTINSTLTSGSGGIPLPNSTTSTGAGTVINGTEVFANGTIITSVNGVQMTFLIDPKHVTVPSPPQNLKASAVSSSQIKLSWGAPKTDGGSPIRGYEIQRSTDGGSTWSTIVSNTGSTTRTYSDEGLAASTTYTYRVFAINSVGTSNPSNMASATTEDGQSVPQPPSSLSATAVSSSQINLSWAAPSSNGGSQITGYKIERSTDGGSTWNTLVANTESTTTSYSDTGLAASTTYTYRVSAINSVGTSSPSNTASATTGSSGGGSSGLVLDNVQSTSTTVSSSPFQVTLPNFNAGTGSNQLLVVGISANNNFATTVTFGGVPLTQAVASFHNNDAEFYYLVNPSGTGNIVVTMSGSTSVVVGAYSFSGVDLTNPIPGTAFTYNAANSSPSISITTKFANDWVLDLPSIWGGETLGAPTCTPAWDHNVPNQITGASSYLQTTSPSSVSCGWTASNGDMWDDVSLEIKSGAASSMTVPSPPQNLQSTSGSSAVTLSWSAPASNGGSAITGYNVYRGTGAGQENPAPIATGIASTTYTDSGLTNGQTYFYVIRAVNSVGSSQPSNEASGTPQSSTQPPSEPTSLSATAVSSSQINLSWAAPSSNGGSQITGYKIERSTDGGSTWGTLVANTASTGTAYSDTGLAASTTYTYRVSAINSVGTSSPSNTASATTGSSGHSVVRSQSGLQASDSLTNETESQQQLESSSGYWTYGGDAPARNAPFDFDRDSSGLHIGVQAPAAGKWAGFYAVSPNHSGQLWHAVITAPVRTVGANEYDNGLYVQTANGNINYVACESLTNTQATVWAVILSTGSTTQSTAFSIPYMDNSPNQPLTRDCTIITNGNNMLKVYIDGNLVYSSTTQNLQMPPPFNAYLEPETDYAGQLLVGSFQDYYVTASDHITVNNLPSTAANVQITNPAGTVLATGQVSGGVAPLDVGQYHLPISGTIDVYDSNHNLLASSTASIYGGDTFTFK